MCNNNNIYIITIKLNKNTILICCLSGALDVDVFLLMAVKHLAAENKTELKTFLHEQHLNSMMLPALKCVEDK